MIIRGNRSRKHSHWSKLWDRHSLMARQRSGGLTMSEIDWFEIWVVIFFTVAFVLAYRIGLLFDARWPAVSAPVFVLLGVAALILICTAAIQVIGKEQAGSDKPNVTTARL